MNISSRRWRRRGELSYGTYDNAMTWFFFVVTQHETTQHHSSTRAASMATRPIVHFSIPFIYCKMEGKLQCPNTWYNTKIKNQFNAREQTRTRFIRFGTQSPHCIHSFIRRGYIYLRQLQNIVKWHHVHRFYSWFADQNGCIVDDDSSLTTVVKYVLLIAL